MCHPDFPFGMIRKKLEAAGWEQIMTQEEGGETWTYPHEQRKLWHPFFQRFFGTQYYWDLLDAAELQEAIDNTNDKTIYLLYSLTPQFVYKEEVESVTVGPPYFQGDPDRGTRTFKLKDGSIVTHDNHVHVLDKGVWEDWR